MPKDGETYVRSELYVLTVNVAMGKGKGKGSEHLAMAIKRS